MPDNEFDEEFEPINSHPPRVVINNSNLWTTTINSANVEIPTPNRETDNIVQEIRNNRRGNVSGQVLTTIGIELESLGKTQREVKNILGNLPAGLGSNFKVHRDGSAEIMTYSINSGSGRNARIVSVNSHTKEAEKLFKGTMDLQTSGYELISVPMDIKTAELVLHALLPELEYSGDFISERCATHIHVGGMKNLGFLKNCLKLGLWFDEVFYSLAGMGENKFRGYSNNAIYARPLQNGPYFRYDGDYYQVLNINRALEAENLYEFYSAYGANLERELIKYHPGRYFSINLYSIPRIGTIEFRHFNQSFNPNLVTAISKLCQLFTEIAIKIKRKDVNLLEMGNVFELQKHSYYLEKLYRLVDFGNRLDCEFNLEGKDISELERVIYTYKGIGIQNKAVLTHCRDFEIPYDIIQEGQLMRSKVKPIPDGHTDIHNIKYSSILGDK